MYVYAYFQKRFRLLRSVLGIQKCLALLCWKHTAFCCQPIINHSCPNSPIVSACPMAHFWARMVSIPGILSCLFSHTFLLQTPFFLPSPHSPTLIFNHSSHRLNFLWLSLEKKSPRLKETFPSQYLSSDVFKDETSKWGCLSLSPHCCLSLFRVLLSFPSSVWHPAVFSLLNATEGCGGGELLSDWCPPWRRWHWDIGLPTHSSVSSLSLRPRAPLHSWHINASRFLCPHWV